jgi:Pin2-interacting protein X1
MASTPFSFSHRAKFRRSKQLASISSAALSEILGVSFSSPTAGTDLTTADSLSNTPPFNAISSSSTIHGVIDDQLTTSTTSMADYFAAKMKARREQLNSSLQNVVISDKASDPPDTLYERPTEVRPGLDTPMKKKRKKERMEKRADAIFGEDQKEVSSALDVDVDERRERKRRKKEEKADGSKKKKRLKAEA